MPEKGNEKQNGKTTKKAQLLNYLFLEKKTFVLHRICICSLFIAPLETQHTKGGNSPIYLFCFSFFACFFMKVKIGHPFFN